LLNSFVVLVYINIFKIKVQRSLGCFITIKSNISLTVKSTSLSALKIFFIVFLNTLALLLYVIVLTKMGNNIGFK